MSKAHRQAVLYLAVAAACFSAVQKACDPRAPLARIAEKAASQTEELVMDWPMSPSDMSDGARTRMHAAVDKVISTLESKEPLINEGNFAKLTVLHTAVLLIGKVFDSCTAGTPLSSRVNGVLGQASSMLAILDSNFISYDRFKDALQAVSEIEALAGSL